MMYVREQKLDFDSELDIFEIKFVKIIETKDLIKFD